MNNMNENAAAREVLTLAGVEMDLRADLNGHFHCPRPDRSHRDPIC